LGVDPTVRAPALVTLVATTPEMTTNVPDPPAIAKGDPPDVRLREIVRAVVPMTKYVVPAASPPNGVSLTWIALPITMPAVVLTDSIPDVVIDVPNVVAI